MFNQMNVVNSIKRAFHKQQNINNAINMMNSSAEGIQYKKDCQESLQMRDFDGDGKISAKEMGASFNNLALVTFKDANIHTKMQAFGLCSKAGSIFSEYAGDDGVLDEYEYSAAINSDEYNAMITKYRELQDSISGDYEVEDDTGLQNNSSETNME